ncbi:UDP-N-acetylglucosamine--peptide N-acetylglucosaminyltransferase-like [Metopolophium dirhodum]|uniref:UDP-N-acetylglucosamine--peptide N-acetylglucosaminyltransferase-like n=1 Tax=Metopolophium dirhodum TaxID=44670 RepID=UPI00298FAE6C|nr:UDP-N-acetylglucosamine--peptide N-acetylglucosaminyltransferase-like [Metopolophium dirhodum]XP_060873515.1 UDP-N-acetylglucosamine--peptide N-acetylglucosaminyltransferase-like [Metopolophium dirhodum]XP_060873531.1 UDP-N-acetylglucosamine--peptide N-acetylglucosaminyltransferase-like [Metopolophium dirhodum]
MWIIICCLYLKNQLLPIFQTMSSSSLDLFCPKHSDSEAPISVITKILSQKDTLKFTHISNEFDKLGFTKVKDLAGSTLGKASSIQMSGDTLTQLYQAMEIYSERLDKLLNSAKAEHQNGNFIATQKMCKGLLTHKPKDLNVLLLNAKSFFNCENYEECIECLEKANNINPECPEVLSNFALVCMKKSENNLAKEYLFQVCAIKPYCADAWTNYADFLFKTNELEPAKLAYERVLSLVPELYKARNKYGKLLLKVNKIKEAKKEFKIAHNSATNCAETLNNLADVYYKSGKFGKSILKYKQLLETNPDRTNACFQLGMSYIKIKDYQNAAHAFKKAIKLDPKNECYLQKLAITYCYEDKMDEAAETFKKCLKLKPDDFSLNFELALVYLYNIRNYNEAVHYLEKCSLINPDRIDVYEKLFDAYRKTKDHLNASDACMSMGDLYMEKDDYQNARNSFCCAVLMNPRNAFGHWKMGLTLYQLGHDDLALQKYKHAIAIRPDFPDAYCDMGVIYDKRGLLEQAKVYYEMAIKLSPNDHSNARLKLADISMKKMDLNDAITDNEKQ